MMILPPSVPMTVPRSIRYASCYVYSPQGVSEVCERSRLLCALLKAGDDYIIDKSVERIQQQVAERPQWAGCFPTAALLIPVPACVPRNRANAAARLAEAMVRHGLGADSWCGLTRAHAVHKSATALHRPTVAMHYESLSVGALSRAPDCVILIDDVVTKGRTLLAAAARLQAAFPMTRIHAFAALRTMGRVAEIARLLEPWRGCICWRYGDARRDFGIDSA